MDTKTLIQNCVEKDKKAWDVFVKTYSPLVKRSILYRSKKIGAYLYDHQVKDIMQDIFLHIWEKEKLADLRNPEHIRTWLVILSVNTTYNYCKKHLFSSRELFFPTQDINDIIEPKVRKERTCSELLEEIKKNDMDNILLRELAKLPAKHQLVMKFSIYENKNQREISEILDIPHGSVGAILCRTRKKLKQKFIKFYGKDLYLK